MADARPRRLAPRIALAALLLLVAPCCVGGAWLGLRLHDGRKEALDAALADLRARGEPVTFEDLVGAPPPPEEDGRPLLDLAWAVVELDPPPVDAWPDAVWAGQAEFEALDDTTRDAVRAYVRGLGPFLSLVRDATEQPSWRGEAGPEALGSVEVVRGLQRTQRALCAALRSVPISEGRERDAAGSAARLALLRANGLLAVRWHLPATLDESVVRLAVLRTALLAVRDQVQLGRVDPAAARDVLAPVLEFDPRSAVHDALRAERAATIELLQRIAGDDPGPLPSGTARGAAVSAWQHRLARRELCVLVARVQDTLDAGADRWTDLRRRVEPFGEQMPRVRLLEGYGALTLSLRVYLSPRLVELAANVAAQQSLARLALAALRQHGTSGTWPQSLDELDVPDACRVDPFTDAPFVFERLPDGVRLSSPGPVDAAVWGERAAERSDPEGDGLVWTLRR